MFVFTLYDRIIFQVDAETVDQAIDMYCEKFKRYHRVGLYTRNVEISMRGV